MANNAVVVIDNDSGQPVMVVVPDYDYQLSDPSFNPPNTTQIPVQMQAFQISDFSQLISIVETAAALVPLPIYYDSPPDSSPDS